MRTKHQTDLKWEYPGQYPDGTQNTSKLEAEIWARIEADPHFELAFDKVAEARSADGGARARTDTRPSSAHVWFFRCSLQLSELGDVGVSRACSAGPLRSSARARWKALGW